MTSQIVQDAKTFVNDYWQRWPGTATDLAIYFAESSVWRGPHPLNDLHGPGEIAAKLWEPLLHSFTGLRRRMDIFLGGEVEGQVWVSSAGYLVGHFDQDYLDIPASHKETFIRYGEFCQVQDGKIIKTLCLIDFLDLMLQGGYQALPKGQGIEGYVPPPRTADGVLAAAQSDAEGEKTFKLAYEMLFGGLNQFDKADKGSMGMIKFWHDHMHWYGPQGIGTTRTIKEFEDLHQLPWLRAFPDRKVVWEPPMFGEGNYAATAGWREVVATHTGTFLGHPATNAEIEFRVMDWWRRDGDKLIENWVLIDMVDVFRQFGTDLFAKMREQLSKPTIEK